MAYIDSFTYDIFISYAHLDNAVASKEETGWIEAFYDQLQLQLSQRIGRMNAIKIWWDDKKLDGSVLFDKSIEEGINHSAIIICLLSQGYMESDYCQKELETFYQKAKEEPYGLSIGDRKRIINVLLYNIPYQKWPSELSGTTGFHFFEAEDEKDWGCPMEVDMEHPAFKKQIHDLREAIVSLIMEMKEGVTKPVEATEETGYNIYFGEVADSLRSFRKRTIEELKKQGYTIAYDIPPPFEKEPHEQAVKEKIEQSMLHVHLLDQFPGREIDEEEAIWYPQAQVDIGLQVEKPQLIWMPAETNIEVVEEPAYKTFLQELESGNRSAKKIEFVRGAKSELTLQITQLVEQLKKEQELAKQTTPAMVATAVLLDTHMSDQMYALDLGKSLWEAGIQPYINPVEDNPVDNANTWENRIGQVSRMIFLYGHVTLEWLKARMKAALTAIVSNDYAVEEFIVFMVPPHKDPGSVSLQQRMLKVNVVNNSDTPQLDPNALRQFVQSIKNATA